MVLLDGKKLAEKILNNLKKEIQTRQLKLKLAVVFVGDDPASKLFIKQKEAACFRAGIVFSLFRFPGDIREEKLKEDIRSIIQDPNNQGVVVQLPLPPRLDTQEILDLIPSKKDVDALSGRPAAVLPPTVAGISRILESYKIKTKGENIVIVGAGRLVGYPLALWFLRQNATVTVLNKYTKDSPSFIEKADILISGVGKPNLINGDMVKKGVVAIDAGTSIEGGRSIGDVDFKSVAKKASYITPVPGGVGPLTVACLLENLVELNK